jgi:hypothetical protein
MKFLETDPEPVDGGGGQDPQAAEGEFIAPSPQGANVLGLKQCPNGCRERHGEENSLSDHRNQKI